AAEVDLEQTHDQKEDSDDDQDKAHRETRARAARPRRLRGRRSRRGIGRRRHPGGGGGRRYLDRVAVRCGRHGGFGCGLGLRFGGGRHWLGHVSGRLCLLLGLRNLGKVLGRLFPVWGIRQRGPHLVELRRPVLAARVCFLGLWSVRSRVQVRVVGWFDLLGLPGTRHVPSSLNGDRRGWLNWRDASNAGFTGPWPWPISSADSIARVMKALASLVAASGSRPRASPAAIAAENAHPLPCVLGVSMRRAVSSVISYAVFCLKKKINLDCLGDCVLSFAGLAVARSA